MRNLPDHADFRNEAATTVNAFVHPQPAADGSPVILLSGLPAAAYATASKHLIHDMRCRLLEARLTNMRGRGCWHEVFRLRCC
jgi:hypothetical protein